MNSQGHEAKTKTFNTVSQLRLSRRNDRNNDTVLFTFTCLFPHLEFKIKFISPLCSTISNVDQTEIESLLLSPPSRQEIKFLCFSSQLIEAVLLTMTGIATRAKTRKRDKNRRLQEVHYYRREKMCH